MFRLTFVASGPLRICNFVPIHFYVGNIIRRQVSGTVVKFEIVCAIPVLLMISDLYVILNNLVEIITILCGRVVLIECLIN